MEDRMFLMGSPEQIAIWKTLFGNSVDYIENFKLLKGAHDLCLFGKQGNLDKK